MKKAVGFKKSKILVLTEKFNLTYFHSMFPSKFIVVSDTESSPLIQYQIDNSSLVYLEKKCYLKFGKQIGDGKLFLSSIC